MSVHRACRTLPGTKSGLNIISWYYSGPYPSFLGGCFLQKPVSDSLCGFTAANNTSDGIYSLFYIHGYLCNCCPHDWVRQSTDFVSIPISCNMQYGAQSQVTCQNLHLYHILGHYMAISKSSQQPCDPQVDGWGIWHFISLARVTYPKLQSELVYAAI